MKTTLTSLSALTLLALMPGRSFAQCEAPVNYCTTAPNSAGSGALISSTGTPSALENDFHLVATGCPPDQFMIFFYGSGQIQLPFGNGWRCVGGGLFRLPVLQIDGSGIGDLTIDFNVPPIGGGHHDPGVWGAGDTWYCQGWFRDTLAGGAGFNLTNGLEVEVCGGDTTLVFAEDFDEVTAPALPAGWTIGTNTPPDAGNTTWELGIPSSVGPSAANSPANCVGTNLSANYGMDTDIWLRTPPIDLTGNTDARLRFEQFKEIEASGSDLDFGTIRLLRASNLQQLAVLDASVDGASGEWEDYSIDLPAAAFVEPVVIEFGFQSDSTDAIGLENGGFELPVLSDGQFNTTGGPGWSVADGTGGIWNPDASVGYSGGAYEGQNVGWAYSESGSDAALSNSSSVTVSANTTYILTAAVGNPLYNGSNTATDYRLELLAAGVVLQSQSGDSPNSGQWQSHGLVWNSGPNPTQLGQPMEVRLIAEASNGYEINFDDVSLTGDSTGGVGYPGWYIDDVEVRLGGGEGWEVLPNSPLAPYYHHDDIVFIDENVGLICNISGEIYKTLDGGDSWTRVLNQPGSSFRTLTFGDAMNGWVGNLGPGSWVGSTTDPNPLYATTDGGLSWSPVTNFSGPVPDGICGLQAVGASTIYGAGRYAGDAYFISSTDFGASWTSQNLSQTNNAFVDVLFFNPSEGYITASNSSGNAALLHTTDGGANWTTVITNNAYHYWKIGFAGPTFGYGICWSGPDGRKWIQTYDGGQNWTDRVFVSGYEANGIGFSNEQIGWIGGDVDNTYETLDGGDSWSSIQIDTVYGDYINKFLRVSEDVMFAVGNRVYKWTANQHSLSTDPPSDGFDNDLCVLAAEQHIGRTIFNYTVPEDGHVEITIYERGGLIYDRPVDIQHRAGRYTFEFFAQDDTPALYAAIVTGRYRQRIKFFNKQ